MTRINVWETEQTPWGEQLLVGWFDRDAATAFGEDTYWDGSNFVSLATGSQWNHETLYLTANGRWVLHRWSQWQNAAPRYEFVPTERARDWLIAMNQDGAVEKYFGALESERGPESGTVA